MEPSPGLSSMEVLVISGSNRSADQTRKPLRRLGGLCVQVGEHGIFKRYFMYGLVRLARDDTCVRVEPSIRLLGCLPWLLKVPTISLPPGDIGGMSRTRFGVRIVPTTGDPEFTFFPWPPWGARPLVDALSHSSGGERLQ